MASALELDSEDLLVVMNAEPCFEALSRSVKDPAKVAEQVGGRTAYTGKDAKVVLNGEGKVITAIPRSSDGLRDPKVK
ncbi:hypothetical protein AB9L18_14595 [Stenotrophomonas lactitubi]|uniref:hypothetical protein n=1 Tax=Stenotrophomonas lactitubi TaxID=2045214 RepID=UPI0035BFE282